MAKSKVQTVNVTLRRSLIGEKPKVAVMFHWGETDQSIPLDKAKEVAAAHKDQTHYFYPAGHGFVSDRRKD